MKVAFVTTPLRYPGGKSGLTNFLRLVLATNGLRGGHYVEPYCGGAGAAVALLRAEAVSHIHLNDADPAVYAFWRVLVHQHQVLCNFIENVSLTVEEWRHQREIYNSPNSRLVDRACAFLYLNRVNRSGILNGGLIGGLAQTGKWLMDARFNRGDIVARIRSIADYRDGITIDNDDALAFLRANNRAWPKSTLIYLDPPYFAKGQCLYRNYYVPDDHASIARYLRSLTKRCWIASYDADPEIVRLYATLKMQFYDLDYTARNRTTGKEVIIFGASVLSPDAPDPMRVKKSDVFNVVA